MIRNVSKSTIYAGVDGDERQPRTSFNANKAESTRVHSRDQKDDLEKGLEVRQGVIPIESLHPLNLFQQIIKRIIEVFHYFLKDQTLEEIDERVKPYISPLFKASFVAGVAWFIYYYYSTEQSTHFISLKWEAGTCEEVPFPITQVYKADTHGYWKGDTKFSLSHAIYQFEMEGFAHSTAEFTSIMGTTFRNCIEKIAGRLVLQQGAH